MNTRVLINNYSTLLSQFSLRVIIAVLLFATLCLLPVLPVQTALASSGSITITSDYTLTSNMTFSGTGFRIAADNITLDLNGYTITGRYDSCTNICPSLKGVEVSEHSGVTIMNGTIEGFVYGVYLTDSDNNTVKGILSRDNNFYGVFLKDSDNNTLKEIVSRENNVNGIFLFHGSLNNEVKHCTSTDNGSFGIIMNQGSNYNIVKDCTFTGNGGAGVVLCGIGGDPSNYNTVKNNVCNDNDSDGVLICSESSYNTVMNNECNENGGAGVNIRESDHNTVKDNTCEYNNKSGISFGDDSDYNVLVGCISNWNVKDGITIGPASDYNEVKGNYASHNGGPGIMVRGCPTGPPPPGAPTPPPCPGPATNNVLKGNILFGNSPVDIKDGTTGSGTSGTANFYKGNEGTSSDPPGLVQ